MGEYRNYFQSIRNTTLCEYNFQPCLFIKRNCALQYPDHQWNSRYRENASMVVFLIRVLVLKPLVRSWCEGFATEYTEYTELHRVKAQGIIDLIGFLSSDLPNPVFIIH